MNNNWLNQHGFGHLLLSLIQWGRSFVSDAPNDGKLYARQNGAWIAIFVPVTSITGLPTDAIVHRSLPLTGMVNPNDATNKTIIWSIVHAGSAYGQIWGNTFYAYYPGTSTVRATIINGASPTRHYTQDFIITVSGNGYGYW